MAFERGGVYYWYQYKFVLRSGKFVIGYSHFSLELAIKDSIRGRPLSRANDDHNEILSIPGFYKTRGLLICTADVEYIEYYLAVYPKEDEEQALLGHTRRGNDNNTSDRPRLP